VANNFQIVISATDKATATVKKVNDAIGKFVRPVTEVQRASKALGKEVGLDRLGKSLARVGTSAADVGEKMGRIIAPLAAIVGVGSVAAVAELAKKWGELGAEITRTSQTIGVSANNLQALRGAAQLSGVSADSLTSGLKSLGDTMEDALYGRNQEALMLMNRLGIVMKRNADGAVDTTAAFSDLAEKIAGIKNPQVQAVIARTFGLESVLPLLRKGRDGIAELVEKMKQSGAIMGGPALAAANAYYQSMAYLDIALVGLKNTIGTALIPILQPLIEKMTAWVIANKELIATRFAEVAQGIADALAGIDWGGVVNGAMSFVNGIKDLVDWLGGWKNAMIALVIVMNGSLIASVLNLGMALFGLSGNIIKVGAVMAASMVPAIGSLLLKMALLTETALPALSSAFLAMGAAIEATPVGWIITAIAGIGIAGYELVKHWDDIKHWWHRLWGDMGDDVDRGADKIKASTNKAAGSSTGQNVTRSGHFWEKMSGGSPAAGSESQPGLLGIIRKLENSGDSAVSPAGAIGRYQIMPSTARQYGFDPSKLTDPAYNETVASTILNDLQKKYGGDTDAILAAYNGGPGRANQFLASGRNAAVLPLETQRYLAHSHQLLAQAGPSVQTPYSAPVNPQLQDMARQMGVTSSNSSAAGGNGSVKVEVVFSNTPPGTKTRVQSSGAVSTGTRIGFSMPTFAV
jgi:hypothetical protein